MNESANGLATSTIKNTSIHQLNRSIERALDEAAYTGELNLNGRKLREFPTSSSINTKCDLSDTVMAGKKRLSRACHFRSICRLRSQIFLVIVSLNFLGFCARFSRWNVSISIIMQSNPSRNKSFKSTCWKHSILGTSAPTQTVFSLDSVLLVAINWRLFHPLSVDYPTSKCWSFTIINWSPYRKKSAN